jgi:ComF family protein
MPEAILPVPLHARRLRERGFNQSIELARPASRAFGLPLVRDLVKRSRPTSPQTALDIKQRRQNLRNAFVVDGKIPYSHIAILDDVVTTGSTVNELAKVLRRSGVQTIQVWSIARAV